MNAFLYLPIVLLALLSPVIGAEVSKSYSKSMTKTHTYEYLVILPDDYDSSKKLPLILFLHGAGERGNDLQSVKKHGPFKALEKGKQQVILVAPQCPLGEGWHPEVLAGLLDEVEKEYLVDSSRIYVTGLSMGGYGTWSLAALTPERFAAVAPICGGGNPADAKKLVGVPLWAFHGDKDTAVTLEKGKAMIDSLIEAGGNPKFTIYEGVGHDSWTQTYENPEFYEWLFAQQRK